MGANLFVEGNPTPVVIRVRLPREVNSFADLKEVASALKVVDNYLQQTWPEDWPRFSTRRRRDVRLVRFEVASPPVFDILADPAWIAVFFMILTFYKPAKDSAHEIANDAGWMYRQVKGLTDRQMQLLRIAIRLSLGKAADKGAQESDKMARRLERASRKLLGTGDKPPDVEVIDVENDKRPW
jgi:hypothetical protein